VAASGLFLAQYSEKYSRDKKYALGCLRQLGGLKAGADGSIVEEFSVLLSKLEEEGGKPMDISDLLLKTTTNIISGILFNERMDHDDPKLARLSTLIMEFYAVINEFSILEALLPAFVIKVMSRGKSRRFKVALEKLEDYIAEQVVEHRKSFDASQPRDFVDMYLNKPDLEIGKGFYDTIIAFSSDAVHTMLLFMQWIVLYLGHHPDVQKKIQNEIDEVVGQNQMVSQG
jgi:cytochrome P450